MFESPIGVRSLLRVRTPALRSGMTVLELLVVIAIIGILSVLAVPAIRALTRSNTISSANRQLLDDIALARQRAINEHSIVHVVFVPTGNEMDQLIRNLNPAATTERARKVLTNLWTGAQTRYALVAERTAGDQPGQHHPRYLTGWHTLPEGVFIPERELARLEKILLPFPTVEESPTDFRYALPHIAFNTRGNVVTNGLNPEESFKLDGEFLELARGSVMYHRNDITHVVDFFDARENPPNNSVDNYNRVRIDGLTGRARIERPEIQ